MGVGLAIDDFGSGGTSLAGLRRLPVDTLKVDRSFVHGCVDDPEDGAVVAAVATAARRPAGTRWRPGSRPRPSWACCGGSATRACRATSAAPRPG